MKPMANISAPTTSPMHKSKFKFHLSQQISLKEQNFSVSRNSICSKSEMTTIESHLC